MRILLAALSVGFVVLGAPAALHAEEFPWCVEVDVFTKNCAFTRRDECVEMARNVKSPATGEGHCVANPNYKPPAAAAPKSAKATPAKAKPH